MVTLVAWGWLSSDFRFHQKRKSAAAGPVVPKSLYGLLSTTAEYISSRACRSGRSPYARAASMRLGKATYKARARQRL
jgi:hypothetical protein